jgi:ADP-ribose pyrophosphatase YjhB (NUDIX family)
VTSPLAAGASFAAWTAQRIEVYALVDGPEDGLLLLPGPTGSVGSVGSARELRRVPGVVLAHGEQPRDAVARALAVAGGSASGGSASGRPWLREVLSDVRPLSGHAGLHVLRLVFEAGHALPLTVDPALLHAPDPAPITDSVPGAPPRVQRPAAYALVIVDGEVLLSRVTGLGVWTLPGGGIDHGEHPDAAVRRETFEETGLRLDEATLVDVDSRHFTGRSPSRITEDFHGVRFLYRGRMTERARPQVQEVDGSTDAAAWVSLDRLETLRVSDVVRTALRELV